MGAVDIVDRIGVKVPIHTTLIENFNYPEYFKSMKVNDTLTLIYEKRNTKFNDEQNFYNRKLKFLQRLPDKLRSGEHAYKFLFGYKVEGNSLIFSAKRIF